MKQVTNGGKLLFLKITKAFTFVTKFLLFYCDYINDIRILWAKGQKLNVRQLFFVMKSHKFDIKI